MIHIEHNPSHRQLTVFGLLWLVSFGILGGMAWARTGSFVSGGWFWVVGGLVPAMGLLRPGVLRIVYLLAVYVTFPIGFVISYIILAVVYYIIMTPTGLILRLTGYDPMQRRFDRSAKTYWLPREKDNESIEKYFRQF